MTRATTQHRVLAASSLAIAAFAAWVATVLPIRAADVVVAPAAPVASAAPATPQKFPAWDTVIKDHKKLEGLFNLYFNEKDQSLLMEIRADQSTGTDHAIVEFVARFRVGGRAQRLHERSRFAREQDRWYYVAGDIFGPVGA